MTSLASRPSALAATTAMRPPRTPRLPPAGGESSRQIIPSRIRRSSSTAPAGTACCCQASPLHSTVCQSGPHLPHQPPERVAPHRGLLHQQRDELLPPFPLPA